MYGQPMPATRTPVITKSKPLTLSSLGVGKLGGSGAKSISLNAAHPAPAAAPAPTVSSMKPVGSLVPASSATAAKPAPASEPKKEAQPEPIETVESLDTPEEAAEPETSAPVPLTFLCSSVDHQLHPRRADCEGGSSRQHQRRLHRPRRCRQVHHLRQHHVLHGSRRQAYHREVRARGQGPQPRELVPRLHHGHERRGACEGGSAFADS